MKALVLCIFALSLATHTHDANAQPHPQTKFVIVHGAWGGSWAFKGVDSLMTAHGYLVYRPSLTGQGERFTWLPPILTSPHISTMW